MKQSNKIGRNEGVIKKIYHKNNKIKSYVLSTFIYIYIYHVRVIRQNLGIIENKFHKNIKINKILFVELLYLSNILRVKSRVFLYQDFSFL